MHNAVPGAVSNLTGKLNFTSVVLSWAPPQEPNGIIIAYEVTYTINGGNLTRVNVTDNMIIIAELKPTTSISDISVSAYTSVGQGEVATLTTLFTVLEPREE